MIHLPDFAKKTYLSEMDARRSTGDPRIMTTEAVCIDLSWYDAPPGATPDTNAKVTTITFRLIELVGSRPVQWAWIPYDKRLLSYQRQYFDANGNVAN